MLYQEVRPYRFDDMVGQNYIVENVRAQAKRDAWFHSFILAGQFGSGKTTMARIIAMAANCRHLDENGNPCGECESCQAILAGNSYDFKEIDGASNTGVDNIRELKEYISFRPISFDKKVIIIDEVHKLSNAAFNSLLKVLEEPPEYAIFILCTTEVEAIPETVQSRCAIYRFGAIPEHMIAEHLMVISKSEGIALHEDAALLIAKYSSGAMRNAIKYLEQLSTSTEEISADFVSTILGVADTGMLFDLLSIYMEQKVHELPPYIDQLQSSGRDMTSFMKEVERTCADLILCKESDPDLLVGTESYKERAIALAERYSTRAICSLSAELMNVSAAMRLDGTATSFLLQSVALIQRMQKDLLEKEELAKDLSLLNNEIAGLKAQVTALKKQGVILTNESSSREAVRKTVDDEPSVGTGATNEEDAVSSESSKESKERVDISFKESDLGFGIADDGFTSSEGTEVPFDETSTVSASDSPEEEDDTEEPEASVERDDDDYDDLDDIDWDAYMDEPKQETKPKRPSIFGGTRPLKDIPNTNQGFVPKSEPIPRKSAAQTTERVGVVAASPAGPSLGGSKTSSISSKKVDEVRTCLLEAAKDNRDIYDMLVEQCIFEEYKDHVRIKVEPLWRGKALIRFLAAKRLNNLVEVESSQMS